MSGTFWRNSRNLSLKDELYAQSAARAFFKVLYLYAILCVVEKREPYDAEKIRMTSA